MVGLVSYALWIQHGQAQRISVAEEHEEELAEKLKQSVNERRKLEDQISERKNIEEKLSIKVS